MSTSGSEGGGELPPFLILAIFSAVLGMFQFGFNTGVINAPQAEIERFIADVYRGRNNEDINSDTTKTIFSVMVSAFLVGGMIGGLSGGWLANKVGRKQGLLYTQSCSLIGALLSGVSVPANAYEMLIVGRVLIGLACGLFTGLVPLYVTEIAPVNIRGGMGTFNQLAVTSGIFLSMILGLSKVLGSGDNWPILVSLTAVPSLLQTILLFFMPESPRFLILNKNDQEVGTKVLKKLRGTDNVEEELQDILAEASGSGSGGDANFSVWQLLVSSKFRLALFVTICMHLSQQLSGIVAIFYYSTSFFQSAGISCENSQYATLGVGAIMVTMTGVTIPLMDRLGRRTLHFVGMIGMIVCSILITISLNVSDLESVDCSNQDSSGPDDSGASGTNGVGVFAIISTLAFVVFFALGPGSIPWLITGELFTQVPRSAAVAVATFVNWTGNLAVGLIFPQMQAEFTNYSFLPFTIILILLLGTLFFYLPETKGRSVQDIEALFQVPSAWKTNLGRKDKKLLEEIRQRRNAEMVGHTNYGSTEERTKTENI